MLSELPSVKHIAEIHLTHLTNLLYAAFKGSYVRDKAIQICEAARNFIGTYMLAKALDFKHIIKLIKEFNNEITEIQSIRQHSKRHIKQHLSKHFTHNFRVKSCRTKSP